MAQYDGSIRILTEISTNSAKKSLGTLSQMIKGTAKEISSLRSKMDALKGQKFYTDDYKKLQSDLSEAEKKLTEFTTLAKESGKLNENQQKAINEQIKKYEDAIESIKGKMQALEDAGKGFTLGSDTTEYANYERQLQYEQAALEEATKHYQELEKLKDPYGRLSQSISDLNTKVSSILRPIQAMNTALVQDVNVSGYERLHSSLVDFAGTAIRVSDSVRNALDSIMDVFSTHNPQPIIHSIASGLLDMASAINSTVLDSLNTLGYKLGEIWGSIKGVTFNAVDSIKEKMAGLAGVVINSVLHPIQTLKNVASSIITGFGNIFNSVIDGIKSRAAGLAASVLNGILHPIQTLKTILNGLQPLINKLGSMAVSALKRTGTAIKNFAISPLKLMGIAAKKAFSSIGKSSKSSNNMFNKGFKNILKYGLGIRSFYALVNKLRTAIKEGFGNFTKYSESFKGAVNNLKASALTLKNSFAAAFSPLVEMAIPFIQRVIDYLVKLMDVVGQVIAAITGQKNYTKAIKQTTAAIEDQSKAQNKQLSGLDKLNNMTSSSGGGADSGGTSGMFEEAPVDERWQNIAQWLKDMWNNSDFTELGSVLGTKLKEALDNIPWGEIKEKARSLGKSLATLINGFIEVEGLGYSIGRTLAEAFNTGFEFLNTFVHNLHWDSLGKFIAETLNGIFENIDWDLIYDTFVTGAKGLGDAINSFADNLNWEAVANTISNFVNTFVDTVYTFFATVDWSTLGKKVGDLITDTFTGIDWTKLGTTIGTIFYSIWEFMLQAVESVDFGQIGTSIADSLNGAISSLNLSTLGELLGSTFTGLFDMAINFADEFDWKALGDSISDGINGFFEKFNGAKLAKAATGLISGLLDTIIEAADKTDWTAIWEDIIDFLVNVNWLELIGKLIIAAGQLIVGLNVGLVKAIAETDWGAVWDSILQAFKDFFGIHSPSTAMEEMGTYVIEGLLNGITSLVDNVKEVWESMKETALEIWDNVKESLSKKWESMKETASDVFNSMKEKVSDTWDGLWTNIKGVINSILGGIETMANGVVNGINAVIRALNGLSFEIPEFDVFGKKLGGATIGFSIAEIPNVSIPRLATGAVIPANKEFLAVLGDQKHGTNVEAPLATIEEAVENALNRNGGTGGVKELTIHIPFEVDGKVFFDLIKKLDLEQYRRTGRPSFQI